MFAHDALDDHEAEAMAVGFGGVIRLKEAHEVLLLDAAAAVAADAEQYNNGYDDRKPAAKDYSSKVPANENIPSPGIPAQLQIQEHELPPDFLMEGDIVLTEEQKCHRLAFYEAALTNFLTKGRNERLMMKDKYSVIKEACLRLHNGETASALKRAGFGNIHSYILIAF